MTAAVVLQPALAGELDILSDLYAASFDEPYSGPALASLLATPGTWALIARFGEGPHWRPAGFVIARTVVGEGEILSLGVIPDQRRKGVGRAILDRAMERTRQDGAKAVFLEVGEDNPAAIALYGSVGFRQIGRRANYYRRKDAGRIAALIMRCP